MSERSRVFMPQRPVYRNRDGSAGLDDVPQWIDKYDLSPAERFGRLVSILPVGKGTADVGRMMRHMEDALADFSGDDYMLAVGDPFAIAMAVMVASRFNGGRVTLLKWNRDEGTYHAHEVAAG